jgi:hypothetical protein
VGKEPAGADSLAATWRVPEVAAGAGASTLPDMDDERVDLDWLIVGDDD